MRSSPAKTSPAKLKTFFMPPVGFAWPGELSSGQGGISLDYAWPSAAGGEDGVAHSVDDFFVGGTDSGQHAAEGGLGRVKFAVDEVVRAEPHAALHRLRLAKLEVEPLGIDASRPVVALQDTRRLVEALDRLIHHRRPLVARQVAAKPDATRPPGLLGVAGDFKDQVALLLREVLELLPVGEAKAGEGGMRRKWRRIDHPRLRQERLERALETVAKLLPPRLGEVAVVEQREEHLLLEERFRWRRHADAFIGGGGEQRLGGGHVWQVEQFKKTVHRIAVARNRQNPARGR